QINARAAQEPVQVDRELFDLIKLSTHFSVVTEGAFDITYASVGHLYDFRRHVKPTEAAIKAALPAVNWRTMLLDEQHHTVPFGQDSDVDFRRLRTLFRRERRALSPHHRSTHRALGEQSTQRHPSRAHRDADRWHVENGFRPRTRQSAGDHQPHAGIRRGLRV